MTLLVFDLGGGTLDAALLRLGPGKIQTIAAAGDARLGGHDWDMRMADYVADQFQKSQGLDPRQDAAASNRLLAAVVEAKHALSARSWAMVRIEMGGRSMEVLVTRAQFEEMTADLLERAAAATRRLLAAAGLEWKDVSRLVPVGGATRMPMVAKMLREVTGMEADGALNPDEAVARGAALYAAHLPPQESGIDPLSGWAITDVSSHSLGVEGIAEDTLQKTKIILIPRNTPLPAKARKQFPVHSPKQTSMALQILEGESSLPDECTSIGRAVVDDLGERAAKNWPVEVIFDCNAGGRLKVHTALPGMHKTVPLELDRAVGMSDEEIERWRNAVGGGAGFEAFAALASKAAQRRPPSRLRKPSGCRRPKACRKRPRSCRPPRRRRRSRASCRASNRRSTTLCRRSISKC